MKKILVLLSMLVLCSMFVSAAESVEILDEGVVRGVGDGTGTYSFIELELNAATQKAILTFTAGVDGTASSFGGVWGTSIDSSITALTVDGFRVNGGSLQTVTGSDTTVNFAGAGMDIGEGTFLALTLNAGDTITLEATTTSLTTTGTFPSTSTGIFTLLGLGSTEVKGGSGFTDDNGPGPIPELGSKGILVVVILAVAGVALLVVTKKKKEENIKQ